jgi:hypothetical protein
MSLTSRNRIELVLQGLDLLLDLDSALELGKR